MAIALMLLKALMARRIKECLYLDWGTLICLPEGRGLYLGSVGTWVGFKIIFCTYLIMAFSKRGLTWTYRAEL